MEYPDDCSTTIRHVVRKVAAMEGRLVCLKVTSLWEYSFQIGRLAYDNQILWLFSYIFFI